jgi:hypothetical protein
MAENYKEGYMQCVAQLSEARAEVAALHRRVIELEGPAREAFEILAALDLAVRWELAPEIMAQIRALVPRMLTVLVGASQRPAATPREEAERAALERYAEAVLRTESFAPGEGEGWNDAPTAAESWRPGHPLYEARRDEGLALLRLRGALLARATPRDDERS